MLGDGAGTAGLRVLCPSWDAHHQERPTSALLRRLRKKLGRDRIETTLGDLDEQGPDRDELDTGGLPAAVERRLREAGDLLLHRAETGLRRPAPDIARNLLSRAVELERIGLTTLAGGLRTCATEPSPAAGTLLHAVWTHLLHRQVAAAEPPRRATERRRDCDAKREARRGCAWLDEKLASDPSFGARPDEGA
ncbi:MAG: hypothetical protein AAGD06_19150 [Acidobacteriota bacterium]